MSVSKAISCAVPDPPPWAGCFLNNDDNVFIKSKVLVDGLFGNYQECNPAKTALPSDQANIGSFVCCHGLDCSGSSAGSPWAPKVPTNSSDYCYCDRTNRTVGQTTVASHFSRGFGPGMLTDIAALVGGRWFSTPAAGECVGAATVGDGSGCT